MRQYQAYVIGEDGRIRQRTTYHAPTRVRPRNRPSLGRSQFDRVMAVRPLDSDLPARCHESRNGRRLDQELALSAKLTLFSNC